MYNANDTDYLLKKNKPNIIFPIIASAFALCLIIIITALMILGEIAWYYGLVGYAIFIAFAGAAWYNGYFSKKKNSAKIKNYEEETKVIVNYVKRYKESAAIKVSPKEHIYVTPDTNSTFYHSQAKYNQKTYSFGSHEDNKVLISFGVSFAGLEVDPKTSKITNVAGVLPISIWLYKKLKAPVAQNANLHVEYDGINPNPKVVVQYMHKEDFYYDKKTGWLMVGERKKTPLDEAYFVQDNVIVVLRDKEIVSLWIQIEPGIKI